MFGLFAPEKVDYIDLRSGIVTFLSQKRRSPGSTCKVRFVIPATPKQLNCDLNISLINVRPSSVGKGFICVGHVLIQEHQYPELEELLGSLAVRAELGNAARRSPRHPVSLRVMSRDLPGFGAVTIDISRHGVRLSTHGPLKDGAYVRLTIELDVGSLSPHLVIPGKAVWSRPEGGRAQGHIAGIEFCDVDPSAQDTLDRYNKALANRLGGDVMHKTIADGEMYVRHDDNVKK